MASGYRGIILVLAFIAVDCILIWIVNTNRYFPGIGVITGVDQLLITAVLAAAGVIAAIAAIMWKLKPWK